jgi:arylsulfatase A-like enzyme
MDYLKRILIAAIVCILFNCELFAQKEKPNIIVVLVDDMGYSDLGIYGSEIKTPNIDQLASQGIRFKQFYNNSICAPTRASLITGQYPHKAGMGYFNVNLGLPAYQGYLNKASLTFAEVLKQAGYQTFLSGKWHVGNDSTAWPNQRGFDHFFGFIGGASSYLRPPAPGRFAEVPLIEDNKKLKLADGKYLTDEITDHAVKYLEDNSKKQQPFFLYLAYNAPHWPLQALPEDIEKYKGRYDIGWDSLRHERLEKLRQTGLLDNNQTVADKDGEVLPWASLTYAEKKLWALKMEVYAAMIDHVDQGIGKILAELKTLKKDDNTIIIFMSDNGAPAEDVDHLSTFRTDSIPGPVGTAASFESQSKNWSYVSNTPFRSFKAFAYEGGISSPFIAWFPKQIKPTGLVEGGGHIIDIAPTLYEIAGAKYPANFNGFATNALPGKSLVPVLFQQKELQREQPLFWERAGNKAVRKGNWKLVSIYPINKWELYNIENDRGETKDISTENADKVKELIADYNTWAKQNGVVDFKTIQPKKPLIAGPLPGQIFVY